VYVLHTSDGSMKAKHFSNLSPLRFLNVISVYAQLGVLSTAGEAQYNCTFLTLKHSKRAAFLTLVTKQVNLHFLFMFCTCELKIFVAHVANCLLTFPGFAHERKHALTFLTHSALVHGSTS
jgi:hypothetical protein